jgi:hypothetical protein
MLGLPNSASTKNSHEFSVEFLICTFLDTQAESPSGEYFSEFLEFSFESVESRQKFG